MSLARLLAHYESPTSKAVTLVPVEFCQELARSLRAEKLTRRLYRLLPPDSVFAKSSDVHFFDPTPPKNLNLNSPMELPGLRYIPSDPARRKAARHADAIATLSEYVWTA